MISATIVVIVSQFIFSSCSHRIVEQKLPLQEFDGFSYWKPTVFDAVVKKGGVSVVKEIAFFNSTSMRVEDAMKSSEVLVDKSGVVHFVDSVGTIYGIVPDFSRGKIILKAQQTNVASITILFPLSYSQNVNFEFCYNNRDSTFVLDKTKYVTLVLENKQTVKLQPATDTDCFLLFKKIVENGETKIELKKEGEFKKNK